MTPEEFKWKAWVAEHGEGIHLTEKTLKEYLPDAKEYDEKSLAIGAKHYGERNILEASKLPLILPHIMRRPSLPQLIYDSDDENQANGHWDKVIA